MRRAGLLVGLALSLAVGGGCQFGSDPLCPSPDSLLVGDLSCEEAGAVERWIERLSARPLTVTQQQRVFGALREREASGAREAVAIATAELARLDAVPKGLDAARARGRASHAAHRGGGPFPVAAWPVIDSVRSASVAVWAISDADELVLAEMDVEGWIRFASLCREAQGATPLKLSIADRVPGYRSIADRFAAGPTPDRLGMIAIGGGWRWLAARWRNATYDAQQAWMGSAPLPPPMTGTSRDYLEAVTAGSPAAHATAIEIAMGPLPMVDP